MSNINSPRDAEKHTGRCPARRLEVDDHRCTCGLTLRLALAKIGELEARLEQANKLQDLTLSNEVRWMHKHDALQEQVAALRAQSDAIRDLFRFRGVSWEPGADVAAIIGHTLELAEQRVLEESRRLDFAMQHLAIIDPPNVDKMMRGGTVRIYDSREAIDAARAQANESGAAAESAPQQAPQAEGGRE